jgi:hypothetical protein
MTRPSFDTPAFWNTLSPEQQLAIGVAAIDREIVIYGRDELGDGKTRNEFDELDSIVEDRLQVAVEKVMDLTGIEADQFPLPSCTAGSEAQGKPQQS